MKWDSHRLWGDRLEVFLHAGLDQPHEPGPPPPQRPAADPVRVSHRGGPQIFVGDMNDLPGNGEAPETSG